jgi:murein DD-endopeptidase MepM/ murein hydrolase activator NlpD
LAHYFVNRHVTRADAANGVGRYWRDTEAYSGWGQNGQTYASIQASGARRSARFRFQVNLHLLAQLLGDSPGDRKPPGSALVDMIDYTAKHRETPTFAGEETTIAVQPWEAIGPMGAQEVPIGNRLASFLDDPLGMRASLELGLPFLHRDASVSQTWIRAGKNAFHGGLDFSVEAEPFALRPLFDACAAADGRVWMLLNDSDRGHQGGVVLLHEPAPGLQYATLYQHLRPASVNLAVGEYVRRGQKIGRVRRWMGDTYERTHLHFNLLVRGPDKVPGLGSDTSRLWFAIDPFGVFDEHNPMSGGNYNYIPYERGGATKPIRGAERTIHWRGNPPIEAYSGELTTPYSVVRSLQMRSRSSRGSNQSPGETAQMLVWLEGESHRFHVRLGAELDRAIEEELCALLRDAYAHGRRVRLGYRFRAARREVSAAWVR